MALAIGIGLVLAGCQGRSGGEEAAKAPAAAAKAPAAAPAPAVVAPPAGADGVDAALAAVKAYNEGAVKELAAIAQDEARIRAAATRALEAARGVEGASEGQRQGLSTRISAARREAEAAKNRLFDGQAKLRKDTDAQITAVEGMLEACAASPELAAYAGCQALEAEHALLLQNIEALTARYQAADAAYGPERAKLEEASAAVALAAIR